MEILQTINIIILLGFTGFIIYNNSKSEKQRFEAFVRATKSKNVEEFNLSVAEDIDSVEKEPEDEFVDPYDEDPKVILDALKKK